MPVVNYGLGTNALIVPPPQFGRTTSVWFQEDVTHLLTRGMPPGRAVNISLSEPMATESVYRYASARPEWPITTGHPVTPPLPD